MATNPHSGDDPKTARPFAEAEASSGTGADTEGRWLSVAATAADFLLLVDTDGIIRFVNRTLADLSFHQVVGTHVAGWAQPEHRELFARALAESLTTESVVVVENLGTGLAGEPTWYQTRIGPWRENGRLCGNVMLSLDITERKRMEQRLTESDRFHRALMDGHADAVVVFADAKTIYVNEACERMLDYAAAELLAADPTTFVVAEQRTQGSERLNDLTQRPRPYVEEYTLVRRDGEHVPVEIRTRPISIDGRPALVSFMRDVSERRRLLERLVHEEQLLRKLYDLQERERKLIAHEIHDGFIQYVIGAKMRLEGVLGGLQPPQGEAAREVAVAIELLASAASEGRRLISDLRPLVIDDEGLVAALHQLAADLGRLGLRVEMHVDCEPTRLDATCEGTVFRIVQEALSNVQKHSRADAARVTVRSQGGMLTIEVEDAGCGFDPSDVAPGRYGVRGIQERARIFGGQAQIESRPGAGTRVTARLPLPSDA